MKDAICFLKKSSVLLMIFLVSACSGKAYEKNIPDLYWPPAPDQPRFKLVNYYKNMADVVMRTGLMTEESASLFTKPYGITVTSDGSKIFVADLGGIGVIDVNK